jgi:hypothetical protein
MSDSKQDKGEQRKHWVRIPDGTMVRHRQEGHEGYIDGLTEIVDGLDRNPDGRTQYRIKVGDTSRKLAVEDDLLIVTDANGLVLILKQKVEYRGVVSTQLHGAFAADRFVKST